MDHITHCVLVGIHQPGDRLHRIATRRSQHDHRPAVATALAVPS